MKICITCFVEKHENEFPVRIDVPSGRRNQCQECTNAKMRSWKQGNVSYWENKRAWEASNAVKVKIAKRKCARRRIVKQIAWKNANRKRVRESNRKYAMAHPESVLCHARTHRALRSGILTRLACEVCGDKRSQAHHANYMKPLEVKWLCRIHHMAEHFPLEGKP